MAKNDPKAKGPKAQPSKSTAVAPRAPQQEEETGGAMVLVQDQVPEYLQQHTQGKGRGSENVGADDLVIPRLEIVQAASPCLIEKDPAFIKGAVPGMLFNSVTRHLYGKAVTVIPVHYTKQYLVWRDRKLAEQLKIGTEGGFFGAFDFQDEAKAKAEAEGGEKKAVVVVDTPQHLCLCVDHESGEVSEVMLSMPRTKAKISRQWNSMIKLAGGDRFARAYEVTTKQETNTKGTFYNYAIIQRGFPSKPVFKRAEELYAAVASGKTRVVMDANDLQRGDTPADDDGPAM